MGEKWDKIRPYAKNFIKFMTIILVFIFISYSDNQIDNENNMTLISISIISLLFAFKGLMHDKLGDTPMLLVYGLYIITIYGYTFYQWQISSKKTDEDCSMTIPRTKNFSKSQYYLYRIMYLTTIIVIVVLIQNLLDKRDGEGLPITIKGYGFTLGSTFNMLIPFILPMLTEFVNGIVSKASPEYSINPESLLANFMLGDSKSDTLTGRLAMPIVFYLILIIYAFIFAYWGESNTPIYFMLIFVIGFSFCMRTIFVQDCSLKPNKDISKDKDEDTEGTILCLFEKYGGLQAIIATCFLINMLSYIKNPVYKLFVFIIIGLASGLLSTVFMLNLKN